jgi:hypothetical protein
MWKLALILCKIVLIIVIVVVAYQQQLLRGIKLINNFQTQRQHAELFARHSTIGNLDMPNVEVPC